MKSCVAYNCSNRFKKGSGITFHRFPKKVSERRKWIIALRRKNWYPSNSSYICSKHFSDECFDRTGQTVRLRENVIPTLFDFPSRLQKKNKSQRPPTERIYNDDNTLADASPSTQDKDHDQEMANFTISPSTQDKDQDQKMANFAISQFHTYHTSESSESLKRKNDELMAVIEEKNKKMKSLSEKVRRSMAKSNKLSEIITKLKENNLLGEDRCEELSSAFGDIPMELYELQKKKTDAVWNVQQQYSEQMQKFSLTLHYLSGRAYDFVRKEFSNCLPDISTLRKWKRDVDGNAGFSD